VLSTKFKSYCSFKVEPTTFPSCTQFFMKTGMESQMSQTDEIGTELEFAHLHNPNSISGFDDH